MQMKFFSIVVVSLNPGERLKQTINSILEQTFTDYEVIIKDGGSKDDSLDFITEEGVLEEHPQIRLITQPDKSIYDGMNQAVAYANGKYVQFLNCGDLFYEKDVLQKTADIINKQEKATGCSSKQEMLKNPTIFYGDQYNLLQNSIVTSAPQINDFTCYRNVPCHQVCFYDRRLFEKRAYLPQYTVRADYEHFLHCIYEEKADAYSMPVTVCMYEGGGYSETKENRKKSAVQHKEITKKYLGKKAVKYRLIMILTLSGLRGKIAESPRLSKFYNAVKSRIYKG